jgi:type I restriction enzyme S subunit
LTDGDILFARTGATTGKSHLIDEVPVDAVFASYLIRVRALKGVNPAYLYAFFSTKAYWKQIGQSKTGSAQAGVNASRLSNLTVPLASQQEQEKIASILSTADAKIAAEKQCKAALEELFRSALKQLMTGQIRIS